MATASCCLLLLLAALALSEAREGDRLRGGGGLAGRAAEHRLTHCDQPCLGLPLALALAGNGVEPDRLRGRVATAQDVPVRQQRRLGLAVDLAAAEAGTREGPRALLEGSLVGTAAGGPRNEGLIAGQVDGLVAVQGPTLDRLVAAERQRLIVRRGCGRDLARAGDREIVDSRRLLHGAALLRSTAARAGLALVGLQAHRDRLGDELTDGGRVATGRERGHGGLATHEQEKLQQGLSGLAWTLPPLAVPVCQRAF